MSYVGYESDPCDDQEYICLVCKTHKRNSLDHLTYDKNGQANVIVQIPIKVQKWNVYFYGMEEIQILD